MLIPIDSLDDPRIAAYRNLKDRELAGLSSLGREGSREGSRFIAEGELVVRRLLASGLAVESVLLAEHQVGEIAPLVPPAGCPVYVAGRELVSRIVGFKFHSGVIAVGRRPAAATTLDQLAASWHGPVTLVVLPEVTNTENMGSLLRISGAFGSAGVVLGPRCCDPFYRQSVRVSMGAVFKLALVRSTDLAADLGRLRTRFGVQLIGAVVDESAEPLAGAARPERIAVLFGNEAQGLPADVLALCDRRVTIPMKLGTDSLNVAVAAGIFLFQFTPGSPT